MSTLTNSQRLAEIRKKREEESKGSSSQSVSGNMTNSQKLAKRKMERSIGFDTLDYDLSTLNTTLNSVYSGWQTPETIKNTRTSVESIQNRLKDLGTYQSRYGVQSGLDLDSLSSGYKSVLENLDMLESVYGDFETADAYDGYMKKQDFKEQFGGLSFNDVQKKKSEYGPDSDEYNFLNEYGVNVGYSNLNDYDAELASILEDSAYKSKLTEARNVYALDHTFDKYAHYLDMEGAEELSNYNPDEPDNLWEELKDMVSGPDMYAQINSEAARAVAKREASSKGLFTAGGGVSEYEEKGYDRLTEDERKVYNIIRNSEGEKAAQAFLEDMEITLSKRRYDENTGMVEKAVDDSAFNAAALSALSIPANLAGSAIGAVDAVGNKLQGKEYNPYGYNKMLSNLSADTRQYVGENIAEATEGMNFLGQNVPAFLYQTAMSMGDSAGAAILGGGIGSALLGSSAALQQAKELKEAGATEGQVIAGGLAAGAFETLFEKYSLDSLLKNKGVDSLGRWAVESLKQAGVEGSEEIFTETANLITDTLLRGQNSDALKRYHEYLERGFSEMEAGLKVVGEDLSQIALSGIGGALSGGIMGGTVSAASGIQNKQTGKDLKAKGLTADVLETAGMSTEGMESYKLQNKLAKKGITEENIKNARLGNLYNTMNREAFQNAVSQVSNDKLQIAAHRLAEMGYKGSDIMELSKAALTEETARSNAQKQLIERSGLPLDSVNALRTSRELNEGYKPSEDTLKARDQVYRLGKINEGEVISDKAAKVRAEEIRQERPNLSQNEALMEAYAEGMDDAKRETFFGNSEGIKDVDAYVASFNLVYEYGRDGFGAETALNNRGVLSPSQTAAVYKAGIMNKVAERQKNVDAITAKYASDNHITAGTFDDSIIDYNNKGKGVNWSSLNTTQRGAVALAKTLSKATGINITLTESKVGKNGKYEGAAGSYNPVTNTIELDINSGLVNVSDSKDMMVGAMVSTLSHETTHWMKDKAPQLYQQLTDIVMDTLSAAPGYTAGGKLSRENIIHREMDRIESAHPDIRVAEEYAVDELVARACEDMLSNSKTAQEYLEQLPEAERKSLYEKIKDAIDRLKQWIKDLLGQYSSKSTEAQILREYKEKLDALQDTWDKAFKAAVTANQALQKEGRSEEEEVQYSDRTFAEDIKEWAHEGKPENEIFILGTTGDVLQGLGAIESDIYMHGDKIKTILEEHPEITLEEIKKIPQILDNPILVLKSKGRHPKVVLFGSVKAKNGKPMLTVLDLRPTENGFTLDDMQKVSSAYTKTETHKLTAEENGMEFVKSSEILYAEKNKTTNLLSAIGFYMPITCNHSGFIGSITYKGTKINIEGKSFDDVFAMGKNNSENTTKSYQDRFTDDFYELFAEGNTMEKESEVLGEDLVRLADVVKMTGKKAYTDKLTDKVARFIRTEYSSNYDQSTLAGEISKIYDYIANEEDLQWNDVMNVCYELAGKVLGERISEENADAYPKHILNKIRNTAIQLSDEQADVANNTYGSNYRFLLGSRIRISKDGVALSEQWQQWAEQYPDIFDASITGAEQIIELVDLYSDLKDASKIIQHINDSNVQRQIALEIYNKFWTLQMDFVPGKYEMDVKKLKSEHRKAMDELKNKEFAKKWYGSEVSVMLKSVREQKDAKIQEIKTRSKERMDNYKDRVTKKALVDGITKKAKSMNKRLKENSKNAPIPEVMKPAVTKLLAALDFSSRQLLGMYNTPYAYTPTKTDTHLSDAFAEVRKMALNIQKVGTTEDSVENLYVFFPDAFVDKIEKMVEETNNIMRTIGDNYYILNEMSVEQLESLNEVIDVIRKTCADINEMHATRNKEKVNAIAQDSMVHMHDLGERNTLFEGAKKFLGWSNTLPINAFRRFGHGGEVIFEAFQDAWDKYAFMVKGIIDYTEDLYKPKDGHKKKEVDVRAWSKEVLEFQVIDKVTLKYRTVRMPVTHAMSLYCLSKREQARKHILGGGIRVEDFTEKGKKVSQTEAFTLGETELNAICSKLTQKQKEVADALQAFMNTECAAWGNETSMQLYGIRSFTEKNYFPITSDKNALNTDGIREDSNSIYRLLNMSFTKPLNLEAENTIMVRNIFDVFTEHSSDMAKYHCFGPAVLDAFRWFNYKEDVLSEDKEATQKKNMSVKEAMERAYGKAAQEYVLKFLKDINGSDARLGDADTLMKKSISKFKRASVGANLRVGLLQPMSYLRAAAVINPKYLAAGMIKKPAIKEAKERSGIALWKSLGFYDVNISRGLKSMIKHDETWVDKLTDKSMIVAEKMDSLTWGVLWNACKAEVEDKHRDLVKGSEAYYHAVGDRFREVVYKTQVVDSTMTRTQMMREKGAVAQITTAFMSESMVSYNMVMDVFYEWTEASRLSGSYTKTLGKYGRKFTRAVGVYAITAFATALAGGLMDAARDEDDEKEFLEKYWENVKSNFLSDLFLPSKLPIVKDIVSIFQGYNPSRMDEQGYQTAYYAYKQWDKVLDGKGNPYKAVYQTLQAVSQMTGVPLGNMMREIVTLWNITVGSVYPSMKRKLK